MVIEKELIDFTKLAVFSAAIVHWFIVVLVLIAVGLVVGYLWELARAVERAQGGRQYLWTPFAALVFFLRGLGAATIETFLIVAQVLAAPLFVIGIVAVVSLLVDPAGRSLADWMRGFPHTPAGVVDALAAYQERQLPSWWTSQARQIVNVGVWVVVVAASALGLWFSRGRYARTLAIAGMTIKDSLRQRVLYVLPFFLVPMLFAGWYLPTAEEGRLLYLVSFVWIVIGVLMFLMVLFLVAMSIPNDLKSKTIQTVLTKPVRRSDLVLGRILGFVIVFTGMLGLMSVLGFGYIFGQVADEFGWEAKSSPPFVSLWYKVDNSNYTARRPIYASQSENPAENIPGIDIPFYFLKDGLLWAQGTNVGHEWGYRSHIEGRKGDAAFWHYHFDPRLFVNEESVRVQMRFDIFKTTKGNPTRSEDEESGVFCQLQFFDAADVKDPRQTRSLTPLYSQGFRINNNRLTEIEIPAKTVASGHLVVKAECTTGSQFLGMAKHDLYLLAGEGSFEANYFKAMFGLWLQVVFWISVAVAASTFLNGFVSILVTVLVWVVGLWHDWVAQVAGGQLVGGGPVQSLIRLMTQANQVTDLDPGWRRDLALWADPKLQAALRWLADITPNLTDVTTIAHVADGYDISPARIVTSLLLIAAYVVPVIVVGCLLFRSREVAA